MLSVTMRSLVIPIFGLLALAGACGDDSSTAVDAAPPSDGPSIERSARDLQSGEAPGPDAEPHPYPDDSFCRRFSACAAGEVCDFSSGRCERREVVYAETMEIFRIKPEGAAPGDRLVIDGQRFYGNVFDTLFVTVTIGGTSYGAFDMEVDENRIALFLRPGVSGPLTISGSGLMATATEPLTPGPAGQLACDEATPAAPGVAGPSLDHAGPFGAGYLDLLQPDVRIYYPASCGGLRRPAVKGSYPTVMLLSGDGAVTLNYEYLGQYLASWGFIAVLPATTSESELAAIAPQLLGKDLGTFSALLAGVQSSEQVAFVGHSRGTARTQQLVRDAALTTRTVACVFLGPVDDGLVVPGLFMVIAATGDLQSNLAYVDGAYGRQSAPKWKIWVQGGNHSLFSDHKVWLGPLMDEAPTIERSAQMGVVASFVLPLMQRAFAVPESFPSQLESPPSSELYTFESALP